MPGDGKSKTQSGVGSSRDSFGLAEALENVWQEIARDTYSCVRDANLDVNVGASGGDADAATVGSELDRVRQEIPNHLLNPRRVGVHDANFVAQ